MRNRVLVLAAMLLIITALGSVPLVRGAGTEPAPQVVDSAPARGEELPVDASVTLFFDQAMDRQSVEKAFSVTPSVPGAFTWTDDTTVIFKPSATLARNTEYAFSVSSDAKSKPGIALRDTFTLKLRTPGALAVSQIIPRNNAKDVEATPPITVIFNRPGVPLLPVEEMAKLPSPITISPAAEGKGEWLNTSIYTFKPTTPLAGGTRYTVTVKKGLADITGSVLQSDVVITFSTVSPRVIEIQPENNRSRILRDPEIEVTFSQPMDKAATEHAFTLKLLGPSA